MNTTLLRVARLATGISCVAVVVLGALAPHVAGQEAASIVVVETTRGSFAFETYPAEAPLTVAHVVDLVKKGFYDGQRIHRAIPGFVVQFGDPQTRDLSKTALWGRGQAATSGKPIGAAEITRKRTNIQGAVAMAHQGYPAQADSQMYITLAPRKDLDGRYAVFGQVIEGDQVPAMLQVGDQITRMYVRP